MGRPGCSSCCPDKHPCENRCEVCVYPCIEYAPYPPIGINPSPYPAVAAANPLLNAGAIGENPTLEECWVKGYENYTEEDFNCPCNDSKFDWVLLICNINEQKDDEFNVCLNGYNFGPIAELGIDKCQGKFFATSQEAIDLVKNPECSKVDPLCCIKDTTAQKIVAKDAFLFESFHLCMENTKNNHNGNFGFVGIFRVHTYKDPNGEIDPDTGQVKDLKSVCPLEPHGNYFGNSGENIEVNFGYQKLCPGAEDGPLGDECKCEDETPYGWNCVDYECVGPVPYGSYETQSECLENCEPHYNCDCYGADAVASDAGNPCVGACVWKWEPIPFQGMEPGWVLQADDPWNMYLPCKSFTQTHTGEGGVCDQDADDVNALYGKSCRCFKPKDNGAFLNETRSIPCQRCEAPESMTWSCQEDPSTGRNRCQLGHWGDLLSYATKQECMDASTDCQYWACEDTGHMVTYDCFMREDGHWDTKGNCQEECVDFDKRWHCGEDEFGNPECQEAPDGDYATWNQCVEECFAEEKWHCSEDADGNKTCQPGSHPGGGDEYANRDECIESGCPSETAKWLCENGDCIPHPDGNYETIEECNELCDAGRWDCDKTIIPNICIEDPNGEFATKQECINSCEQPIRWDCVEHPGLEGDRECIPSVDGEYATREECQKSGCEDS